MNTRHSPESNEFHLQNDSFSYIIAIVNGACPAHVYYGRRIGHRESFARRVPAIAAKIALAAFVAVYALLQLVIKPEMHFLNQLAFLFVASCVLMMVIGIFKKRDTAYSITDRKVVDITPWKYRYEAGAIIVAVMVSMYLVFSPLGTSGSLTAVLGAIAALTAVLVGVIVALRKFAARRADA